MGTERAVAFLDLLGFSSFCDTDSCAAIGALEDYQSILDSKIRDEKSHPVSGISDPAQQNLAQNTGVSSFGSFLPFSDSFVILSDQPGLMVVQLSNFLVDSFLFCGHAFTGSEDPVNPERQKVTFLELDKSKKPALANKEVNWFPVLFRGALAWGEAHEIELSGISKGERSSNRAVSGPALVEAVGREKAGAGPRLFCGQDFLNHLPSHMKQYVVAHETGFEVLWPAISFSSKKISAISVVHALQELLSPAFVLLRAKRGQAIEHHYFEFIRLLGRSAALVLEKEYQSERLPEVEKAIANSGLKLVRRTGFDVVSQ